MPTTDLIVVEGHQLIVHGAGLPEQDQEVQHEENEFDRESLAGLAEEILHLEETIEFDRERMKEFIRRMSIEVSAENHEIEQLSQAIQQAFAELKDSDDIEDQALADEAKKEMDEYDIDIDDEDDSPRRQQDFAEDMEFEEESEEQDAIETRKKQKQLIKHLFKLITIKTHPDKCGNTSKLHYYRDAVADRDRGNLYGLKSIYKKVYGHAYGKSSLYDRLLEARRRREALRQELTAIRGTGAWHLYQITLETDFERAVSMLRENLRLQIHGMRAKLSEMQNQRNWM